MANECIDCSSRKYGSVSAAAAVVELRCFLPPLDNSSARLRVVAAAVVAIFFFFFLANLATKENIYSVAKLTTDSLKIALALACLATASTVSTATVF